MQERKISSRDQAYASAAVALIKKKLTSNIHRKTIEVKLTFDDVTIDFKAPGKTMEVILQSLELMAEGKPVEVKSSEDWLTAEDIASEIGISRYHVVKLIEQGILPSELHGKRNKVKRVDLNAYILKEANVTRQTLQILEEQISLLKRD